MHFTGKYFVLPALVSLALLLRYATSSCVGGKRLAGLPAIPVHAGAPRAMPEEYRNAYTCDGQIEEHSFYIDETNGGKGSHIKYSKDDIEQLIVGALSYQRLPIPLRRMRSKNLLAFWSDLLLQHHPQAIQGAKVVVFGSTSPQYEVGLLARGAASVVTVEYNKLTYDHPQLSTMQVQEAEAQLQADSLLPTEQRSLLGRFDLALSVSSFDHDGLGRYGDPLNPDGDLLANDAVQQYLKPSGAYLFAVPVGPDAVVWNLQRRYGAVRLPLMLGGWAVVDVAGWNSSRLAQPAPVVRSYEPAWLLQPTSVPTAGAFASEVLPLSGLLSGAVLPPATADPMQRSRAKHAVPSKQPQQQTGSEEL